MIERRRYQDLTEGEIEDFRSLYPTTRNADLQKKFNISGRSLGRLKNTYGLKKDDEHMWTIRSIAGSSLKKPVSAEVRLAMNKKHSETKKKIWHSEMLRVRWGLPQKTKLHISTSMRGEIQARSRLKHRGYIIPERGSRTIYYDANSPRNKEVEEHYKKKFHFTFKHIMSEECKSKDPVKAIHSSYISGLV